MGVTSEQLQFFIPVQKNLSPLVQKENKNHSCSTVVETDRHHHAANTFSSSSLPSSDEFPHYNQFQKLKEAACRGNKKPHERFGQRQPGLCLVAQHKNSVCSHSEPHLQLLSLDGAKASLELLLLAGTWEKLAPEVLRAVLLTN